MASALPASWPHWTNPGIVLFHGTVRSAVPSILAGVDIRKGDPETDFGRGFYTTTLERQAREWAVDKSVGLLGKSPPAVIRLTVDRIRLAELESLAFVRGARDAVDYWSFVSTCRKGQPHRAGSSSYYDVVYGPVAIRWEEPAISEVFSGFDQIGFHTSNAEHLLNDRVFCMKELLPW